MKVAEARIHISMKMAHFYPVRVFSKNFSLPILCTYVAWLVWEISNKNLTTKGFAQIWVKMSYFGGQEALFCKNTSNPS